MKRYQLIIIVLCVLAASFVGSSEAADNVSFDFGGAQYVQTGESQSTDTGASVSVSFSF